MSASNISGIHLQDQNISDALERLCLFGASGSGEYVRELQEFLALHAMALLDPGYRPALVIYNKVKELVNFDWALDDILQALTRIAQRGEIDYRGNIGQLESEYKMPVSKISTLRTEAKNQDRFEKQVLDQWKNSISEQYHSLSDHDISLLVEDIKIYLLRIMSQHAIESLSLFYGEDQDLLDLADKFSQQAIKDILPWRPNYINLIRSVEFPKFFRNADVDRKKYISGKMNSVFILHLLQLDPTCASLARNQIPGGTLYLDTNYVYRLVGIQGPILWDAAKRLKDLSEALGYRMVVSPRTIEEYKVSLNSSLRRAWQVPRMTPQLAAVALQVSSDEDMLTAYWRQIIERRSYVDPSTFFDYYLQIEDILNSMNVSIVESPAFRYIMQHDSYVVREEGRLEEALEKYGQQVRHPDISNHDAFHRLLILQERGSEQNNSFIETRYWLLTIDSKLPRYDRFARIRTGLKTSYCVLASQWLQAIRPFASSVEGFETVQIETLDSSFLRIYKAPPSDLLNDIMSRFAMRSNYVPQVAMKMFTNRHFLEQFEKAQTKEEKDRIVDDFYEKFIEQTEAEKAAVTAERDRAIADRDRALQQVAELTASAQSASAAPSQFTVHAQQAILGSTSLGQIQEATMGSKYSISGGNVGAVGDNARAENFSQIMNSSGQPINLTQLAEELSQLRSAARQEASEAEHDIDLGSIAEAERAAKQGDAKGVLEHLSKVGEWVLDVATKIGTSVAAEVIKRAMFPTP